MLATNRELKKQKQGRADVIKVVTIKEEADNDVTKKYKDQTDSKKEQKMLRRSICAGT